MIVVLDTGPLGMVTNPRGSLTTQQCKEWLAELLRHGVEIVIPEIADYELRRSLLLHDLSESLARLDGLVASGTYLPITTPTMVRAAELWASARKSHRPTADSKALDGDMILCALVETHDWQGEDLIVATTDVGDLPRFINAANWQQISAPEA